MRTVIDLTGRVFGKWSVLGRDLAKAYPHARWICQCQCGQMKSVRGSNLVFGSSSSCRSCAHAAHGKSHSAEYRVWAAMKRRCLNPNTEGYLDYGGRGIVVCDEWKDSFEKFYSDMGPRPSTKHSIDRIEVNGNYTKENCRWATQETQARNTRVSRRSKSGCRGVSWDRVGDRWKVMIRYEGKNHCVGSFKSLENAIASRWVAEATYWRC